jgi:adenylate cyclase
MQALRTKEIEDYNQAILLFERAVALEPSFAPALAYAALGHETRLNRGGAAPVGGNDAADALALAKRAVIADPEDAFVLASLGLVLVTVEGDAERAIALIEQALSSNPNSLLVLNFAGYSYFHRGEFDASTECH